MALRESISEASKTNLLQTASFSTNKTSEKTGKFSCGKSEAPGTGKANNDLACLNRNNFEISVS